MSPRHYTSLLPLLLAGCASVQSYVDPLRPPADDRPLPGADRAIPVHIEAHFLENGVEDSRLNQVLARATAKALDNDGLLYEVPPAVPAVVLKVTVDERADPGLFPSERLLAGATAGWVTGTETDDYQIELDFQGYQGRPGPKTYSGRIVDTTGNAAPPFQAAALPPGQAFDEMYRRVMRAYLREAVPLSQMPARASR